MANKKPVWIRAIDWLSEVSGYISGLMILLATLVIVHQVIVRYFFGHSTIWQTEFSTYLVMFTTFVGAAYGLKHNSHVGIDVLVNKLPVKGQSIMKIITSSFSLLLTIVVAWKAWEMWYHATEMGWKSSTVWAPPLTYPYFILPLGMSLVSLQFIVIIYDEYKKLKSHQKVDSDQDQTTTM
ncbi:TRAP transporter small permease [Mesobacillus maritimus]|uniref:TRAP transporter small permease subunit n=1 Tax=Mesobacillus maritimus TaxID=1643336 RepID=UPI002040A86F|nr:TRAP transporter small permease [Mesobacillus maritimus]MCM3584521.1 TRAP transporter small permease [Mesobacillus maritimus]MCM3670746.1 TRAP transporter small permease [Mesobacillus maritimus]